MLRTAQRHAEVLFATSAIPGASEFKLAHYLTFELPATFDHL
jgi:hypothetical protein